MNMREKFEAGQGIRLPGGEWIYAGKIYDVPKNSKGVVFRKAIQGKGITGHVVKANPRQLRVWMENGTIPPAKVKVLG